MLKVVGLITGRSVEEIVDAQAGQGGEGGSPRGLVVSEVLDVLRGELTADTFVESWWDDHLFDGGLEVEAGRPGGPGWPPLAALGGSWWLTTEHVFKSPDRDRSGGERIKVIGTAYRGDGYSIRSFFDYWRDVHAPLSARAPGLGGYVVSEVVRRLAGPIATDAFVEQWWPDRATLDAASASPEVAAAWDDVLKYAKPTGTFWVTREHIAIAPAGTGPGWLER